MRASEQWFWRYQSDSEQLSLILSDELIHILPYRASKLIAMVEGDFAFDTDDAEAFQTAYDYMEQANVLDGTPLLEAAINAAAWSRFGRPQMPQSWHFQQSDEGLPNEKRLCELNSGFDSGIFYILNADEQFATCMLLSSELLISDIKSLQSFETVKVLLNRLQATAIDAVDHGNLNAQHSA